MASGYRNAFMHTVIPNLSRLGLITERTEPRGRSLRQGPRRDVQASLHWVN
jgi:hypothetical protein